MKVIISGGGTGGHVFPAIAIANAIRKERPDADILFVGAQGKIEMEKVPKAGYPIEGLWISGFQRKLTTKNLLFPFKLMGSLAKAYSIVSKFKPDVVVGVGGYASGPTLEVASRMGIPIVVQEQNSYPGITNRLLAKRANRICVAYEGMDKFFPKEKVIVTGNPIREGIFEDLASKKSEGYDYFDMDASKKTIFVFGGSLGARTINDAMKASTQHLQDNKNIQVLWQAGKLYIDEMKQTATAQLPNVVVRQFIDRMDLAYAMADIVIGRAGALTISELCYVGKPAILVPSPNVSEDHQTKNALALVNQDAAILVKDANATKEMIPTALNAIANAEKLALMTTKISALRKESAAATIANEIIKLAVNAS